MEKNKERKQKYIIIHHFFIVDFFRNFFHHSSSVYFFNWRHLGARTKESFILKIQRHWLWSLDCADGVNIAKLAGKKIYWKSNALWPITLQGVYILAKSNVIVRTPKRSNKDNTAYFISRLIQWYVSKLIASQRSLILGLLPAAAREMSPRSFHFSGKNKTRRTPREWWKSSLKFKRLFTITERILAHWLVESYGLWEYRPWKRRNMSRSAGCFIFGFSQKNKLLL